MSFDWDSRNNSTLSQSVRWMQAAVFMYAAGSIAAGVFDLIWGEFEKAHQPIQALGDHIPGVQILAYIAAVWLILGGVAMLWRRTAQTGAAALAGIYLLFAAFCLPRFYTAPRVLGLSLALFVGLFVGVGQQLILVASAGIIYDAPRMRSVARWIFGLSSIDFGLAHFMIMSRVTPMVPKWLPLGGNFWSILTGVAFVLAGIAILSGILDVLAARLLALMLFLFNVLVLAPGAIANPHNHIPWGSNAYNLAAAGAAWIFAESLAAIHRERAEQLITGQVHSSSAAT